ncbi:MAG: hypothetical protein KTR20_12700 [Cellvibrionaceae bacterium]|nr:hypothetical protein [Cellvibrionaceae bacterium]
MENNNEEKFVIAEGMPVTWIQQIPAGWGYEMNISARVMHRTKSKIAIRVFNEKTKSWVKKYVNEDRITPITPSCIKALIECETEFPYT